MILIILLYLFLLFIYFSDYTSHIYGYTSRFPFWLHKSSLWLYQPSSFLTIQVISMDIPAVFFSDYTSHLYGYTSHLLFWLYKSSLWLYQPFSFMTISFYLVLLSLPYPQLTFVIQAGIGVLQSLRVSQRLTPSNYHGRARLLDASLWLFLSWLYKSSLWLYKPFSFLVLLPLPYPQLTFVIQAGIGRET